jgi:hypothetical protein
MDEAEDEPITGGVEPWPPPPEEETEAAEEEEDEDDGGFEIEWFPQS